MLHLLLRRSFIKTLLRPPKRHHSISFSTSPLFLPDTPPTDPNDHHSALCFSLLRDLLHRNLIPSAQRVLHRMIFNASSPRDAISAVDFASCRGMPLDMVTRSAFVNKLVQLNELKLAEYLFVKNFFTNDKRVESLDVSLLNSMVVCYCRLRKINDALRIFNEIFERNVVPSREACTAVVRELCVSERVLDAYECCNWISAAGVVLDFPCYNKLVEELCLEELIDEALDVFHLMWEGIGTGPTAHVYTLLFYKLYEGGQVEDMQLLCWDMEDQGLFIDKFMYTSLINDYCKCKDMKAAMLLFFRMLKIGCDPDVCTYTTLIQGFNKLGMVSKSLMLRNLMKEMGVQPDPVTHHVEISRLCKEMKVDSACSTLRDLVHLNLLLPVHSFTIVISSLCKVNCKSAALEVCELMFNAGIVPDHVVFFILKKNFPGHELRLALLVLRAIAKLGCGLDPSVLSTCSKSNSSSGLEQEIELLIEEIARAKLDAAAVAFGIYIAALCELRKKEAARHCMDRMVGLGCMPLLSTFNSLIKCHLQEGLVDDAKSLIEVMPDMGVFPGSETFLVMIKWCCSRGDAASAFDLLDQMEASGLRPSVAIYDSIIGCLSREKRIFEAHNLFMRMLEVGVDLDQVFFVNMINAYSKSGWVARALQLFDLMLEQGIEPNGHAYTALINGLVKKNWTHEAYQYLKRMLGDGFKPNTVLYTSLINQYSKKGEFEIALTLLNLMVKSGIELDMVAHTILVGIYCRNIANLGRRKPNANPKSRMGGKMLYNLLHKSSDPAIETGLFSIFKLRTFIEGIKDSALVPNLYLYNAIIAGFCRGGRMRDAYDYFELLQRHGLSPNQVTFTILINGHVLFGDIDGAIGLFNKMNKIGCTPDKIAYNALLQGLSRTGRLVDALSLSFSMHKRGFFPNKASYELLLNSLRKSGLSSDAFTLLEDMQIPCLL